MGTIVLSQGYVSIVDDEDVEVLSIHRWKILNARGKLYAVRNNKGKTLLMHRVLLRAKKGEYVDHRNGDGLDNRRENIRIATQSQNRANSNKGAGVSRFKGVYWNKERSKWHAQIGGAVNRFLGRFIDEEEAARAYDDAAFDRYGDFALLNFPKEGS